MPDNRINIELNLQLVDTSNAVNKLAELRAQLNGLGEDTERVSRQQGYIGLRGVENTARSISQNIEEVRGSVVPNEERIASVRAEQAESRPRTTQLTIQENLSSASERLAEASKVVTQQYVQARTTAPLDLQTFINQNVVERNRDELELNPNSKSSMFRTREYEEAKFTREGYAQVFNEEQNGSQGRVTAAYAKEQAQRTEIARSEGARRAQIAESEVTSIGRNVQRDVAIDDIESSNTNSTRHQTRRVLNNATILDTLDQNKVDKSYIQRAQQSIQEGERATFGPIVTAETPRFFRPAEIARSQASVRRMERDRERDQPEVQAGPSNDALYAQQLAQAIERNKQREQVQREELFGSTVIETPELNPNVGTSDRTQQYNVRINAQDNLPDPAKIAAVTAEIENLTAALNNMSAAEKKDTRLVDTIKSEITKKETELRSLNAKKTQDPEIRKDFEETVSSAQASGVSVNAIKRAQKEFERGNIDAAKSILTVNNELERTTQQAQRSKVSLTTIGDIISGRSGMAGGPDAGRDFEKGGSYQTKAPIMPGATTGGGSSGSNRGRQEELNKTFGSGPEELGGFRAFRGINRMGALEIQAAVINSIQALSSGMSLPHVAMMESTQIGGGLIQGGLISFGQIMSFLATTTGMATAALVGLAAGITAIAYASSKADAQLAEAHNTAALQGRDAVKVEQQTVDMASQMAKSGTLGREESRTFAGAINMIPGISQESRLSLGRSGEGIARLDFKGDIEAAKKGIPEIMSSIGQMKSFSEKNNLFGNNQGMRDAFDAAAGIGDKLQASTVFAQALEERARPTSQILKASREEIGTIGRNLDIWGSIQENILRRMTGTREGGFFSGAFFPTPRFQSGTEPVTETAQEANQASSRARSSEIEIQGLIIQRKSIQAGLREQPQNTTYQQALTDIEYKIRETRTPVEQQQRQVSEAQAQARVQQAQQAAQIDPSRAREVEAAARAELVNVVVLEQSAAATRSGIVNQLTAQRIEAQQRYISAIRETQRIELAGEISSMQVQRATRPADLAFQTQIVESEFQTTVRNPAAPQTQKDERLIENIKAHQQEDLETQNVVITQLRANMALAEARGELEEINRLRREENDIIQSRPDIRSRLERATSTTGVEQSDIQTGQRQIGRQILRIDVERSLNSTDATFQRVALERELDVLIKSGRSTEEQRLHKNIEIINAKRQERLEAENVTIAQSQQSESILRYREDIAGIVQLRRQEAQIIQSSKDRTDVEKIQSQTQLIQAQLQALRQSVQLEEQFVESSNRFTAQRVQTQTTRLNYQVETGAIRPSQALQAEQGLTQKAFAEQEGRLQTLLQDQALQPTERARINSQLASLYEQDAQKQIELQTQITRAIRDENERRVANFKAFFKDIESGTTSAFASVITRQQTAAEAVKQLRNTVITSFITNAEEMLSKAAGKALAPSFGINLKEGEDSSISSIFSKALGGAFGLTTPEPKLDQSAVASKMQQAGELQKQAGELMLRAAQSARNEASKAPLNAGTGRPPDIYTPEKNQPRTINEIPRELYETKAQPGSTSRIIPDVIPINPKDAKSTVAAAEENYPEATTSNQDVKLLHEIPAQYAPIIQKSATENNISPEILANLLYTESKFNPNAVSPAGAQGIAQFIPSTAKTFGIDPSDPNQAIPAAAQYVAKNREMFGGNTGLALAGYNWGEGNVQKWMDRGAKPADMPAETRNYVSQITGKSIEDWTASTATNTNKDFGSNNNSASTAVVSSVQNINPQTVSSDVSSSQNAQNQLNNSTIQSNTQSSFSPIAFGDSISAHLIRKAGVEGQESGQVGVRNVGDTAVSGYSPQQVLSLINEAPQSKIQNRDVVLSSGVSNNPAQIDLVGQQISALKDRGAQSVTVLGVGTAERLAGSNEKLAQIAQENNVAFAGPLRSVTTDQIHSSNNQDLFRQISEVHGTQEIKDFGGGADVSALSSSSLTQQQSLKVDSSSVVQGVVQGQQQANQQIGGSVSSTNVETNSARQQNNSEIQQNNSETQQNNQELRQLNQNIQTIQNQKGATASGGIGGDSVSTTSTNQIDSTNLQQQQATIQQTSSSLDQLGVSATTTQTNLDASSSSATTMGGSLDQAGQQAAQAGQQFAQVESSKLSGTTNGSGTTSGSGSSSGSGLLSGIGELASVATAFSALTGTKTSSIVREITAGVSLISSISKMFSSGGLLGGLFGGGGGSAASGGGSAFGGIGSLFSGFTSLFSLFALNEGGVFSAIPSASAGMMLNQITVPSAAGGIHVQESSLSSSIRTGIQNMAASGNVVPFSSARVTPSYSGPFGVNDGKGGRLAILHPHEMVVPTTETKMILSQIAGSVVSANDGAIVFPSAESGFMAPGATGAISAKSISLPSRMSSGLSSSITNGHNITAISNDNSSSSTTTGGDTHVHNYSFNITSLDPRGAHKVIMDNADSVIEAYDRKRRNFGTRGR